MIQRNWGYVFSGLLLLTVFLTPGGQADQANVSVSCSSQTVSAPVGGGTGTANVDCILNAQNDDHTYYITPATANLIVPASVVLTNGSNTLTAIRNAVVTSPDTTVTAVSGTSAGFTGQFPSSSSVNKLRFQYTITTTSSTPAGTYTASSSAISYQYNICSKSSTCNHDVFNGIANVALSVSVPQSPVSVSCASPAVNALPGGGPFILTVICTASGGNATQFTPSSQNMFSPASITLTSGTAFLTATLQPAVTSPNNSVIGIVGTAGGGFTGTVPLMPAKIQVQYTGSTKIGTPGGTYTSSPVTFRWSAL